MPQQLVLADDLSGACEAASAYLLRTTRITVQLSTGSGPNPPAGRDRVLALDLDSRRADPARAASMLARVLAAHPGTPALVKVDSLLRGHLDALVAGAATAEDVLVVLCTASPALGRTVRGGVVQVDGVPLHDTGLWRAEAVPAPTSVAAALPSHDTCTIDLSTVRGPIDELVATLRAAAAAGRVPAVDAETEADLDALVAAAHAVSGDGDPNDADPTHADPAHADPRPRLVLVGAGGLAAAVARALPADDHLTPPHAPSPERVLVVVGSAAPLLHSEVDALRTVHGAEVTDLSPAALLAGTTGDELATAATSPHRTLVVRVDPSATIDPAAGPDLARALADAVVPVSDGRALVLTGGETARAVLDRLAVRLLHPIRHDRGAVTALTDDGRTVVTRPGSFGTGVTLAELVTNLLTDSVTTKEPA